MLGEGTAHRVQEYIGGQGSKAEPLDFTSPAITVATYLTAKGLEFDAVFLPFLPRISGSDEGVKMQLYVMCSRARDELHMSYSGEGDPSLLGDFPRDLMDWP